MLEVKIESVSITDIGFVVFLKNEENKKVLPIFVGPVEAQAISVAMVRGRSKRPMTHDLIRLLLSSLRVNLEKVEITEMREDTFYSVMYFQKAKSLFSSTGSNICIDARPSDAIALAMLMRRPVYVSEKLFFEHGIEIDISKDVSQYGSDLNSAKEIQPSSDVPGHRVAREGGVVSTLPSYVVSKKTNDELGLYQKMLDEAVREERFEDASRLRDKINSIIKNDT